MNAYPKVNYIGNKEKIADWIVSLIPQNAETFFDAFSGGASVSYAAKKKGLCVYSNDILRINYFLAKSWIENNNITLTEKDVDTLFQGVPFEGFMYREYANTYYYPDECKTLDLLRHNIESLNDEYKKALAFSLIRRAMIRKMPYSRFTINWSKIQQLRDEKFSYEHYKRSRSYHNKSFKFHFEDNLSAYNNAVFSNRKENKALNLDVFDAIDKVSADVIYMDPPYAGTMNDYHGFYGVLDSYIKEEKSKPFDNNFQSKDTISEMFEKLFGKLGKYRYWMLSYNSKAKPAKDELLSIIYKFAKSVEVFEMPYAYKVTGKEKKQKDIEYLFRVENDNYGK